MIRICSILTLAVALALGAAGASADERRLVIQSGNSQLILVPEDIAGAERSGEGETDRIVMKLVTRGLVDLARITRKNKRSLYTISFDGEILLGRYQRKPILDGFVILDGVPPAKLDEVEAWLKTRRPEERSTFLGGE